MIMLHEHILKNTYSFELISNTGSKFKGEDTYVTLNGLLKDFNHIKETSFVFYRERGTTVGTYNNQVKIRSTDMNGPNIEAIKKELNGLIDVEVGRALFVEEPKKAPKEKKEHFWNRKPKTETPSSGPEPSPAAA